MKVLVTGANGMLGQDLSLIFEKKGYEVIRTDYDTLDITNEAEVDEKITEIKPDLIVHCAAYTNVDKAEDDYDSAYKLNVYGTSNVAKTASKIDAVMVYISTDYVFDGTKDAPYLPSDVPNPINAYGKTKYLGEVEVQSHCKKYYIARTAWLYGHKGKNFVETMLALALSNPELKVVNDQIGSPTSTIELTGGILKILDMEYGIYHISGENEASWYDFANEIFNQAGVNVNLKPCTTDEFPRPAKRPKYSYMTNADDLKLTRDWKSALSDYLMERNA